MEKEGRAGFKNFHPGTEPKIKWYSEMRTADAAAEGRAELQRLVRAEPWLDQRVLRGFTDSPIPLP